MYIGGTSLQVRSYMYHRRYEPVSPELHVPSEVRAGKSGATCTMGTRPLLLLCPSRRRLYVVVGFYEPVSPELYVRWAQDGCCCCARLDAASTSLLLWRGGDQPRHAATWRALTAVVVVRSLAPFRQSFASTHFAPQTLRNGNCAIIRP